MPDKAQRDIIDFKWDERVSEKIHRDNAGINGDVCTNSFTMIRLCLFIPSREPAHRSCRSAEVLLELSSVKVSENALEL
jgi:hypothetical protein